MDPSINVSNEQSASIISSSIMPNNNVIHSKKGRNISGLIRYKPGQSGNPAGKPKGTVQIKDEIRRKLNKQRAGNIAESMIAGAEAGDDKKRADLLRLTGDFAEASAVSITTNNNLIGNEVIEMARQFLANRDKPQITAPMAINATIVADLSGSYV
jgi:hypothetical protein